MTAQEDDTVESLFSKLIQHKIMAIPVLQGQVVVGIVSLLDLIAYVLKGVTTFDMIKEIDETTGWKVKLHMNKDPVSKLLGNLDLDPPSIIEEKETVFTAAKLMIANHSHRILVYSEKEAKLTNLITQSRLIQLISTIANTIPLFSKTVKDLDLVKPDLVTIKEDDMAYLAFRKMKEHKISGIGIVNSKGILTGNISISDFKMLGDHLKFFGLLGLTSKQYCESYHSSRSVSAHPHSVTGNKDLICIKPHNTLLEAVKLLQYYRIHRVWIVDEEGKPVGVVALTNVIQCFEKDE